MKKVLFISISIFIICLLVGCKKDEPIPPTSVNGQVLEQGTNKPIEGVKVVLMEGTYNGFGSGTYSYRPIDTVFTDKDGRYTYSNLTKGDFKDYVLWFYKDQYYIIDNSPEQVSIKWNKTSNVITKMFPFAWLKLSLINSTHKYDYIYVAGVIEGSNNDKIFIGNNIDTTFIKKIKGNSKLPIFWTIRKTDNSIGEKQFNDTLLVKGSDTLLYRLIY